MDPCAAIKRGPHHPRSEQSKTRKVDQHLTHEEQWVLRQQNIFFCNYLFSYFVCSRIDDDLKDMGINVNLDSMSDEEKNFYYFKVSIYNFRDSVFVRLLQILKDKKSDVW